MPLRSGVSALAVLRTSSLPLGWHASQAQPEPKWQSATPIRTAIAAI
jgi:hypothetical protein